jgi:hypothetical protein
VCEALSIENALARTFEVVGPINISSFERPLTGAAAATYPDIRDPEWFLQFVPSGKNQLQ